MKSKSLLLTIAVLLGLRITATAQTPPSYVPTDGLAGWWPFNGNANDESGNGNDGTVNGATLTEDRLGTPNACYNFNGTNQNIQIANSSSLTMSELSISAWILPLSNNGCIVSKCNPSNAFAKSFRFSHQEFWQGQHGLSTWYGLGNCNNASEAGLYGDSGTVPNGTWSHVVSTVTGSGLVRHYLNGVLFESSQSSPVIMCDNPLSTMRIGSYWIQGQNWFNGKIDDLAIWNRVLSSNEIQALYQSQGSSDETTLNTNAYINYQAIARNPNGSPLSETSVIVKFTLVADSINGSIEYVETHNLNTNSLGLFTTAFGSGTPELSAFNSINWNNSSKFLRVELNAGNGYVDMGTQQMLWVPFAIRANSAAAIRNENLPVFSDNDSAIVGGLEPGMMYRTSNGALMIVY
ncbi:MAG: LamG domain-containing protein [Flavobacteriales bacterium]